MRRQGVIFTRIWSRFFSDREYKVIIVGLDNAGKTTTLYKLCVLALILAGRLSLRGAVPCR